MSKKQSRAEIRALLLEAALENGFTEMANALMAKRSKKEIFIDECISATKKTNDEYIETMKNKFILDVLNDCEKKILMSICNICHIEYVKNKVDKENEQVQSQLVVLNNYKKAVKEGKINSIYSKWSVCEYIDILANKTLRRYEKKSGVGRPRGIGKRTFMYEGKQYYTIQQCADEYHISKQAMYKRLKKQNVI